MVMSFGRNVGSSFLGALGANIVNDLITGGFHRNHQQFEYPYAYQQSNYNPGLNPALFYGGRPNGFDYTQQYLPQNAQFYGQGGLQWGQRRYPWGQASGGYDQYGQQRGLDQNPLGLSEFDEGTFAARDTLAKRNLCSAVQSIHDMEVMDALTRRHFPGFQSHYARDMFNIQKQTFRAQGYDLRYHKCDDNSGDREFGIFDRSGSLVDRMRVARLTPNEVGNDDIRPRTV
jgi:hypothetical protein